MKKMVAILLTLVLSVSGVSPIFGQSNSQNPFTAAEMQQLMEMGFETAVPADRAAAQAAGVEWRNVASFEEAIEIASHLQAMIQAIEANVTLSGPGDVPTDLLASSQSSSVLTRRETIAQYLTSYIEVGATATRTTTYDPVSGSVRYTWSNAQDDWIGWYGLTLGWLENADTSVSYPSGALKVTYSADIVVPLGPLVARERISGWVRWYS